MNPPKLITFDAAETLVRVSWQPGPFAVRCAIEAGLDVDEQVARETYERLLHSRWREYCALNTTRDHELCDKFWEEITRDWLLKIGHGEQDTDKIISVARKRLYGDEAIEFRLFDDVIPVLESLQARGYRLAVISNWDYSLHRILKNLGLYDYFEKVFASLEEGPEKPDPELFHIVMRAMDVQPDDVVHVGDNPVDDYEGARGVGIRAVIIDRNHETPRPPIIASLHQLEEAFAWSG